MTARKKVKKGTITCRRLYCASGSTSRILNDIEHSVLYPTMVVHIPNMDRLPLPRIPQFLLLIISPRAPTWRAQIARGVTPSSVTE